MSICIFFFRAMRDYRALAMILAVLIVLTTAGKRDAGDVLNYPLTF